MIDSSGGRDFRQQLKKYLRARMNEPGGRDIISKIKMQKSTANNLLQLADYAAGVVNRTVLSKPNAELYRRYIAAREATRQVWPPG